MKKRSILFFAVLLSCISATSVMLADWRINDNAYSITFKTKGARGSLGGLKGIIVFDKADLSKSKFNVTVEIKTIDTGIGIKNKHALAEDFFDAVHYPVIYFTSSNVTKSDTSFIITGLLTIKDITREISFPFTFNQTDQQGVFTGTFEINRKDFNLSKKGIGELVKIELNVPVRNDTIR